MMNSTVVRRSYSLLKPYYFPTVKMLMIPSGKLHVTAVTNEFVSFCVNGLNIKNALKVN